MKLAKFKPFKFWLKHSEDLSGINSFLGYDNLWIGINDRYHEMNFRQADRSVPKFTYWDKDQPDDTTGKKNVKLPPATILLYKT